MKYFKQKKIYNLLLFIFFIPIAYNILTVFVKKTIIIELDSNIKSELQVFYKLNPTDDYSEEYTVNKNINVGNNKIDIYIPNYLSPIRVDIANSTYIVKIKNISLNYLFYSMDFNISETQIHQIDNIIRNEDKSMSITTIRDATDPQLYFTIDYPLFKKYSQIISIILSIFSSIIVVSFLNLSSLILKKIEKLEKIFTESFNNIAKFNIDFSKFYIYFIIGFVFHIFEISNFLLSPDDEYSAFRITPEAWIYDGRWTGFLIEKFIFDQPTMPFIPNIMSCVLMALSYIIILKAHNIMSNFKTYFIFPIFSAFPTLWTINEFYGNMVMVSFGFFIISISILLFEEFEKSLSINSFSIFKTIKILFYPSLLLAVAIGSYQSFIMLAIACISGIFFLKLYRRDVINIKKYLTNSILYIFFGLVLYIIINKMFRLYFPSEHNYISGFIDLTNINFVSILSFVYAEIYKVYTGSIEFFGVSMSSLSIIIFIIFIIVFLNKEDKLILILSLLVIAVSPFLLHFLSGGKQLPIRSMVSLPYVVFFFSFLTINSKNYIINTLGILTVSYLLIQQSSALGQYSAATQIGQMHDRHLAADIYTRISNINPNFNPDDTHIVDIYGYKSVETIYPKVQTSTMNSSFFDWDAGNMSRMISYMRLIGYTNIKMIDKSLIQKNISYFEDMPKYPNKDSIKYIDGVYLIKLGDKPDVYRRK